MISFKLIFAVVFAIIGVTVVILRTLTNAVNQNSRNKQFVKAQQNIDFANSLCDNIDMLYKIENYSNSNFDSNHIRNAQIGKYRIVNSINLENRLLLYAKCRYVDWDSGLDGHMAEISKEKFQFFVLVNNPSEKSLAVYGEIYEDNTDKFMMQEFSIQLLKLIV
jgi:hypothetical protein